jgi:transcriptional regulator GlxA family with amidase domain
MAKLTFWAEEGCMFSGISGLIDALAIANLWHQALVTPESKTPLFETEIVTVDGQPILAQGNIQVHPHHSIHDIRKTDMIVISPLLPHLAPRPERSDAALNWIVTRYHQGTPVSALCTGVFTLAETGLLDGKKATTNWHFVRLFRRRYPNVVLQPEKIMTEDSGLICTGAATSSFSLALHVIAKYGSEELAAVCAKALLVDPHRESQAPYVISDFYRDHKDSEILDAQNWLETNFAKTVTIDSVAQQVGISPRHFKRRFKKATGESPLSYLQRVRIETAKKQLETTRDSMNEITWRIGYEDTSSFRRLFKKYTGLSPREYRDKFSRAAA